MELLYLHSTCQRYLPKSRTYIPHPYKMPKLIPTKTIPILPRKSMTINPKYDTLCNISLPFVQSLIYNLKQELPHLIKDAQLLSGYHTPHVIDTLLVSISPISTKCNTTLQNELHACSLTILRRLHNLPPSFDPPPPPFSKILFAPSPNRSPLHTHQNNLHKNYVITSNLTSDTTLPLHNHHSNDYSCLFHRTHIRIPQNLTTNTWFSNKSHQTLSSTKISIPNQHTNIYPDPITYLRWNCGHLSTKLQDILPLTTINSIPYLFLFVHKTKIPKNKPIRYIDVMQFSSYKIIHNNTLEALTCITHSYV